MVEYAANTPEHIYLRSHTFICSLIYMKITIFLLSKNKLYIYSIEEHNITNGEYIKCASIPSKSLIKYTQSKQTNI